MVEPGKFNLWADPWPAPEGYQEVAIEVGPRPISLRDELIQQHAIALTATTEAYCWEAYNRGQGWRVWRSEPVTARNPATVNYETKYQFQLLPPDAPPPGTGTVFGPWTKADIERVMEGRKV